MVLCHAVVDCGCAEAPEGDNLILLPDKNVVKKRVKAYSFAKTGRAPATEPEGPREGDVLELDLDRRPGEERRGGKLVSFGKMQGRADERWREEEEDGDDGRYHGDVLILEVGEGLLWVLVIVCRGVRSPIAEGRVDEPDCGCWHGR